MATCNRSIISSLSNESSGEKSSEFFYSVSISVIEMSSMPELLRLVNSGRPVTFRWVFSGGLAFAQAASSSSVSAIQSRSSLDWIV